MAKGNKMQICIEQEPSKKSGKEKPVLRKIIPTRPEKLGFSIQEYDQNRKTAAVLSDLLDKSATGEFPQVVSITMNPGNVLLGYLRNPEVSDSEIIYYIKQIAASKGIDVENKKDPFSFRIYNL